MKTRYPALFVSHGTLYEAFKSDQLKKDFIKMREVYFKDLPDAIVILSGHWQTNKIKVTANKTMVQLDEGFPLEFQSNFKTTGNFELSNRIVNLLNQSGIEAEIESKRGLDHGALIPLLLLFPEDNIPVVQISQHYSLDPIYHKKIAKVLEVIRTDNVLIIGSGGLVHNTNQIERFGGHDKTPDDWAKNFDDYITEELLDINDTNYSKKMVNAFKHKNFKMAHPTVEHFIPMVFTSALDGSPLKIYKGFQWKNLSMSAFLFE